MTRRTIFMAVAMITLPSLALTGCGEQESKPESVKEMMRDAVQPTAEVYWGSAGWIIDESGEHDLTPTTEEGWKKAQDAAVQIGQFGVLLGSEEYTRGRGEDWAKFAKGLTEISKEAEKAAIDKNSDAVFEVGGRVYNVCKACHEAYPQEAGPEASNEG